MYCLFLRSRDYQQHSGACSGVLEQIASAEGSCRLGGIFMSKERNAGNDFSWVGQGQGSGALTTKYPPKAGSAFGGKNTRIIDFPHCSNCANLAIGQGGRGLPQYRPAGGFINYLGTGSAWDRTSATGGVFILANPIAPGYNGADCYKGTSGFVQSIQNLNFIRAPWTRSLLCWLLFR